MTTQSLDNSEQPMRTTRLLLATLVLGISLVPEKGCVPESEPNPTPVSASASVIHEHEEANAEVEHDTRRIP